MRSVMKDIFLFPVTFPLKLDQISEFAEAERVSCTIRVTHETFGSAPKHLSTQVWHIDQWARLKQRPIYPS